MRENLWDTPITLDAVSDGSGMASKTIKKLRLADDFTGAITYGEEWLRIHDHHHDVLTTLSRAYLEQARLSQDSEQVLKSAERAETLAREAAEKQQKNPITQKLWRRTRATLQYIRDKK